MQKHRAGARERARRLGQTGRVFRELLGARRANGKEILTLGDGGEKKFLYTAEEVHKAFSGHFDKHFGAGGKSGTEGQRYTPFSKWTTRDKSTVRRF